MVAAFLRCAFVFKAYPMGDHDRTLSGDAGQYLLPGRPGLPGEELAIQYFDCAE